MPVKNQDPKLDPQTKSFFAEQSCLIAETSTAFATSIRASLQELGIASGRIFTTSKFAIARQTLSEKRPTILIVESEFEKGRGFELIEMFEPLHENVKRIVVVTSRSASTSVLMEAADGHVDSHLLKPFSADDIRERILGVAKLKLQPTPYAQKLANGRAMLHAQSFADAFVEFESARPLHDKPALACFWAGEALRLTGDAASALQKYREGRNIQPLNYRCVMAEFQTLFEMQKFDDAFQLVGTIVKNFPMSSFRLRQLFDVVESAKKFDELAALYSIYRELEDRSAELVRTAEAAFFSAGKTILSTGQAKQAVTYFETGVQIAGRRIDYIAEIVSELVSVRATPEAQAFLAKVSPSDVGTPAFHRIAFCVDQLTLTGDQLLNRGREIIYAGNGTPEIFHLVVRSFATAGKATMAESIIGKAVETFPDLRSTLYKLLDENLPKQSA